MYSKQLPALLYAIFPHSYTCITGTHNKNLKYTIQQKVMCGLNELRQPEALPVSNTGSLELKADFIPALSAFIFLFT